MAICDVKKDRRDAARDRVNQTYNKTGCATYNDFREMLALPDIDAVCIATNDHWHVLHALEAVRQGKDVYLEKPMGLSIREIQTLREAVQRYGRVFQFGTQRRALQNFHHGCNLVRNGRIGKLHSIDVGVHSGAAERTGLKTFKPAAIPEGFDYDFWLGPAPAAPFIPQRVINPHWFHVSNYSLGYVGGWGIHYIDIAQWGNDTEHTGPVEIAGTAVYPYDDALCDNPVSWDVRAKYANGVDLHFTGSGPNFPGVRFGVTFKGTEGSVFVADGAIETTPTSLLRERIGPDEHPLQIDPNHERNFVTCVRSRARTNCPIEAAVKSDTICTLSWIAFTLQRPLKWDSEKEVFIGDAEANRMLTRAMRSPWRL